MADTQPSWALDDAFSKVVSVLMKLASQFTDEPVLLLQLFAKPLDGLSLNPVKDFHLVVLRRDSDDGWLRHVQRQSVSR